MNVTLIAAMDRHRAIGKNGTLPWYCQEDLEWFKDHTRGKVVVLGRKTFDSIGHPLPQRSNIVVTRDPEFVPVSGVMTATSVDNALQMAALAPVEEVMVIGGGEVYRQTLPYADRLLITLFDHEVMEPDTFFPAIDTSIWKGVKVRNGATATLELPFSFWEYTRV